MKQIGNTATVVNGDVTATIELRNDGVIALQFICRGSAIGLDVYGLGFATRVKGPRGFKHLVFDTNRLNGLQKGLQRR